MGRGLKCLGVCGLTESVKKDSKIPSLSSRKDGIVTEMEKTKEGRLGGTH